MSEGAIGGAVGCQCATRPDVLGSIPDGVFKTFEVSAVSSRGVHSSANRNEYQGTSLGVKCGRRVDLGAQNSITLLSFHELLRGITGNVSPTTSQKGPKGE
jgi:hypothetical protein